MSCSVRIEQKLCEVKIFQLQSMPNARRYTDKRFPVEDSGISCLALIFNLSNPRTTIQHAKTWFKVARCDQSSTVYFSWLKRTRGSDVALWLRRFAASREIWVRFSPGAEPLYSPLAVLRDTEPVSALTGALICKGVWARRLPTPTLSFLSSLTS